MGHLPDHPRLRTGGGRHAAGCPLHASGDVKSYKKEAKKQERGGGLVDVYKAGRTAAACPLKT